MGHPIEPQPKYHRKKLPGRSDWPELTETPSQPTSEGVHGLAGENTAKVHVMINGGLAPPPASSCSA